MTRPMQILAAIAFLSIAVNVFFAGMVIGRGGLPGGADRQAERTAMRDRTEFTLRGLASGLPPEVRQDLRQGLRARRAELRPVFFQLRQARREAAELLRAQTLDQAALRDTFAHMAQLQAQLQEPIYETLIEAAAKLPPEQRVRLLDRLEERRRRARERLRSQR
ncbi:MAG: periplasmic heavy metal sensor [Rhodothalassiaceae bacterium]